MRFQSATWLVTSDQNNVHYGCRLCCQNSVHGFNSISELKCY